MIFLRLKMLESKCLELLILHEKDLKNDKYPDVSFHTSFNKLSTLRQFENGWFNPSTNYKVPGMQYDFSLSAEIPIYLGGKIKYDEKKAALEVDINKLQTRKDERELRMEIITAYLQVLHLQDQQQLILDKMHEDSLVIKQTKALKKNGAVTYNEVLRTELQLSNHKIAHSELQFDIEIVERIEVITNPSSRYEASGSGGIINIVLKKGTNTGFNGSVTGNLGHPDMAGLNVNLNYKTKKFNWYTTLGTRYSYQNGALDGTFYAKVAHSYDDNQRVVLSNEVVATRILPNGKMTMTTTELTGYPETKEIETDKQVVIDSPQSKMISQGLKANLNSGQYEFFSVRGTYEP